MKKLILIGAGDWGLEIWSWLENAIGYGIKFELKGFLDQNPKALDKFDFCNFKILGNPDEYIPQIDDVFVCTIANPSNKELVINNILQKGGTFINLIHNSVIFFKNISLGSGIVISPNCVISNNCILGNHVSINLSCTLGHDVQIGDFCQINSQCDLTGYVKLGNKVFLGSRVTLIPNVNIQDNVLIGAGSVVFRNIKTSGTYVGNPVKKLC
jgi:sugar O-acyltransferase (sialic acid O-acetyltransferase NeuD family)